MVTLLTISGVITSGRAAKAALTPAATAARLQRPTGVHCPVDDPAILGNDASDDDQPTRTMYQSQRLRSHQRPP
jgi:hypothetical protein